MERIPFVSKDVDQERILHSIMDGALGTAILLNRAPTTANKDLKTNQVGYYSGKIYFNIDGTTYSMNLTTT